MCDTTKHTVLLGAILRKTCAILLQFVEQKRNLGFHTPKGGPHTLEKSKYCLAKVEHCVATNENVCDTTKQSCDTLALCRG